MFTLLNTYININHPYEYTYNYPYISLSNYWVVKDQNFIYTELGNFKTPSFIGMKIWIIIPTRLNIMTEWSKKISENHKLV